MATNDSEHAVQAALEECPILLVQHLEGGHGRWCIPKARLGAEHVPDFLIGERSSEGYEWQAIELESPRARPFTRAGDPSAVLTHAVRQIQDWRAWLQHNQSYASRPRAESGLGLTDIVADLAGIIYIGRRAAFDPNTNARRRQMKLDLGIRIRSYDGLLDTARKRVEWTESKGAAQRRARRRPRD